MFQTMVTSLISLFLCLGTGFVCRRLRVLDDGIVSGLAGLLIKVTLPCTIINSMIMDFSPEILGEGMLTMGITLAAYLFGAALGYLLSRILKFNTKQKQVTIFALTFPNVGYMGFPVIQALLGQQGVFYTSMGNASFNLLAFSFGVLLFTADKPSETKLSAVQMTKSILLKPAFIATFIGFVLFLFSLRPPEPVSKALTMLGAMTTPLSMIILGSILSKSKISTIFSGVSVYVISFLRLVVIPAAVFLVCRPFIRNDMLFSVLVLLSGMPAAAITAIFAEEYGSDADFASRTVFVSTLLSIITMPVFTLLLG